MDPTRLVGIATSGYPSVEKQPIYTELDVIGVNDYSAGTAGRAATISQYVAALALLIYFVDYILNMDRHAVDSRCAAARDVDGVPGCARRLQVHGMPAWRATRQRLLRVRRSSQLRLRQPRAARRQDGRVRAGRADGDGACRRLGCDRHGSGAHGSVRRRLAAIGLAAALLPRTRVRGVAGAHPESVWRARRARGHDGHRAQRRRAAGLRGAADGHRHVGIRACTPTSTRTSRSRRWRAS